MRLVSASWLEDHRHRAILAVGGCVATALLLITLSALVDQLIVSIMLVGLGIPVILLLTQGLEWTTNLVMVAGMLFAPLNSVRAGGPVTAADLLFALGFMLLGPTLLRKRLEISQLYLVGWLIMFMTGLIASILAVNTAISFNHMARFLVAGLVLPTAFMLWQPTKRLVVLMAAAYLAGSTISVVYAVTLGNSSFRPLGLTTHPNFFGLTCVIGSTLVPYVIHEWRRGWRWVVWLAGLICVYGVWISGSRAAFGALGVVAVIYMIVEGALWMAGAMGIAVTAVLGFFDKLSGSNGSNALDRLLGGGSAQGSDFARDQAATKAWASFFERPIAGNGFEHAMEAHSIYLQVLVSIGVIGIVGYLVLFVAMVHPLLDPKRPNYRLAYPALTYALVGIFTNSLWDRFVWAALSLSLVGVVLDNHQKGKAAMDRTEHSHPAQTAAAPA